MVRLKMIKNYHLFKRGEVVYVHDQAAKVLVNGGYAKYSKDMIEDDYEIKMYESLEND